MSKNSQFGDGVPEVKTQCFRGFQPRVHELSKGGAVYVGEQLTDADTCLIAEWRREVVI